MAYRKCQENLCIAYDRITQFNTQVTAVYVHVTHWHKKTAKCHRSTTNVVVCYKIPILA